MPQLRKHSAVVAALSAAALALPILLTLPAYQEAGDHPAVVGTLGLVTAIFFAARFCAQRLALVPHGAGFFAGFALLNLLLGVLGFMSLEQYRLAQPAVDMALLYAAFFLAAASGRAVVALGRVVLALLVVGLSVVAVIQAIHVETFGFPIGPDGYRAILQSNPAEALEFVRRHLGAVGVATACLALVAAAVVGLRVVPPRPSREALGWSTVFALPVVGLLAAHATQATPRLQAFAEAAVYANELLEHRAVRKARRTQAPPVTVAQDGALAGHRQTYVFVVGESLSRNHMSLYGYWRDTTPRLVRLASELAVFTDAVSPHSHTDESLELALTLANQDNKLSFSDPQNFSVIELFRAAGFATWWISNQNVFGPWDNKVSVLASAADHVHYTGLRSGTSMSGPQDAALLEPYAAALRDPAPRKAIFLHFLGNHWEYAKRYPEAAATFRKHPTAAEIGELSKAHPRPELVNEYDDSVRYHDSLVGEVVEMLRASGGPAALVMFSDHGESLYQLKGHYWRQFTHDHVEVPLAIWFSPEYTALAPRTAAHARANAAVAFNLEDLTHLVADLAGLRSPVLEPQRSPLSGQYRAPQARRLFDGQAVYEEMDAPGLNARRALQHLAHVEPALRGRIWAHRVDTMGKMMQSARLFAGVEIDVLYDADKRTLLVNHPPAPASGLTLDALLEYANRLNPELALWLDLKNLNETNGAQVLEQLMRLEARHHLRKRVLIETPHTGPAAALLQAGGFRSSYYLPTGLLAQYSVDGSSVDCYGADAIKRTVAARRFSAISYDFRGQRWVAECLGEFIRARRLQAYAWDLEPALDRPAAAALLDSKRLKNYAALAAVLIPFRTTFDDEK